MYYFTPSRLRLLRTLWISGLSNGAIGVAIALWCNWRNRSIPPTVFVSYEGYRDELIRVGLLEGK